MKNYDLSPVILFVYNRVRQTKICIRYLKKNQLSKKTTLIIFSDYHKKKKNDEEKVHKVREYIKTIKGFKKIIIIERKINYGLFENITKGITEVIKKYKKVIILEDDILVSKYFLNFMNEGLKIYEKNKNVSSIHGYVYPVKKKLPETFFLYGGDCWGWATWKDRWLDFEKNPTKLQTLLLKKNKEEIFNYGDLLKSYSLMLEGRINQRNNSWAILWHASNVVKEKLVLYPNKSFVKNIGFDGSGTHSSNLKKNNFNLTNSFYKKYNKLKKIDIIDSSIARKAFGEWMNRNNNNYVLFLVKKIILKWRRKLCL